MKVTTCPACKGKGITLYYGAPFVCQHCGGLGKVIILDEVNP